MFQWSQNIFFFDFFSFWEHINLKNTCYAESQGQLQIIGGHSKQSVKSDDSSEPSGH